MQTYCEPKFANNFFEIEKCIQKEQSRNSVEILEDKLDEADFFANTNSKRMTHSEVFESLRRNINV